MGDESLSPRRLPPRRWETHALPPRRWETRHSHRAGERCLAPTTQVGDPRAPTTQVGDPRAPTTQVGDASQVRDAWLPPRRWETHVLPPRRWETRHPHHAGERCLAPTTQVEDPCARTAQVGDTSLLAVGDPRAPTAQVGDTSSPRRSSLSPRRWELPFL